MGTDGACGLLFCAAKRSGAFPPNMLFVFSNSIVVYDFWGFALPPLLYPPTFPRSLSLESRRA
jgi:hypothetical protein